MKFKFMCEKCGEDITDNCYYNDEDGYFYVKATCEECGALNSVDLTDHMPHSMNYEEDFNDEDDEDEDYE